MSNIPMIVVRKQPKAYGAFADEYVEGPYAEGQRVLLLEDVVSNGREVMAATRAPRRTQTCKSPCTP
jgi:orotate phosphoribosyltransferase